MWQDLFPGTVSLLGHFCITYSLGSERHWNLKIKLCCKFLKQVIWCPDVYTSNEMFLSSNKLTDSSSHSYFGVCVARANLSASNPENYIFLIVLLMVYTF